VAIFHPQAAAPAPRRVLVNPQVAEVLLAAHLVEAARLRREVPVRAARPAVVEAVGVV